MRVVVDTSVLVALFVPDDTSLIVLACRERDIPAIASFDPDFDSISWLNRLATQTKPSD